MKTCIGGFFPLQLPRANRTTTNFLKLWGVNANNSIFLQNARSCLHYLLVTKTVKKLWLPAYICTSLADAVKNTTTKLHFYPLDNTLKPDIEFLQKNLCKGDYVVAVDYFGQTPAKDFLKFVKSHRDIHWIEDRAQALLPAKKPWGDWVLYSPRKLLGVPDGGILMSTKKEKITTEKYSSPITSANFIIPSLLRFEDSSETQNQIWYKSYVINEQEMANTNTKMSHFSAYLLDTLDANAIIKQRQKNYAYLEKNLADIKFIADFLSTAVPMGFPIKLKNREKVWKKLCEKNIFSQKHWAELPSNPKEFPEEHALSRELLTLPCDHRYSLQDMKLVAFTLQGLL